MFYRTTAKTAREARKNTKPVKLRGADFQTPTIPRKFVHHLLRCTA
jgi:hypothetical protein